MARIPFTDAHVHFYDVRIPELHYNWAMPEAPPDPILGDHSAIKAQRLWADDFLRFAEPPSHDRWIPGTGRGQSSQANLTAHYVAPWVPNLTRIREHVLDTLFGLFGAPLPPEDKPPEAIFRHLRFLRGEAADSIVGGGAPRKPTIEIIDGEVVDGCWHVTCQVRARNRPEGWSMLPQLAIVGLQGRELVRWQSCEVVSGHGSIDDDGRLAIEYVANRRSVTTTIRGITVAELPIPAAETTIEAVIRSLAAAQAAEPASEGAP